MTNYNENIQKAYEIKGSTSKFINEVIQEYRLEKGKITADRNLSQEGKREATGKLSTKYEVGFLVEMNKRREEYESLLLTGKDAAEQVLTAALPPVSEQQQKLFDMTLKSVEGKVTFAVGINQAMGALEALVKAANEPLLAEKATESFLKLSQSTLALAADTDKAVIKQRLGTLYNQLDGKAQVEGSQEAREALSTINAMKGASFAIGYVQDVMKEVSKDAAEYLNTPSDYLFKMGLK
ncbi:hypothetical protein J7E79_07405 [Bacillus sp. ISL-40]|uniref:hypothetical protein n=1 Tax=unclassified Bacillus (in: firmicutes) TaxID=185979 RepID=UPI001BECAE25|nr:MULTISPECIES: hypothetical protein [unclassified Bacillus (in: firmicutes)]MBT2697236.1 hypothetical protein [Bacillus sp. ISL-40]MBT2741188.1 hypothetical protein [Bacillus sp. ISL-77]